MFLVAYAKRKDHNKATCSQVTGDALEMTGQDEQVVGVNGRREGVRFNARVRQVHHVRPPNKRKKLERIIKMKLAKKMGDEGSSPATAMELD
ncbi:unnamed protein product [Lactuca virosa]|uniref:Uncharacterized protein n=1 Tax=Lactuca virosa TaxID=75947 RepID=A0AAU9M607_9ASTR|nr:unnamed protein product [Lactuca virosa]